MSANFITFVSDLIYGDLGLSELPPPPAGTKNHLHWTIDNKPSSDHPSMPSPVPSSVTGSAFLSHHLNVMLERYEAWRSKYFLAPIPPWNGQDVDPESTVPVGPVMPANLSAFPAGYTLNQLGTDVRIYYNNLQLSCEHIKITYKCCRDTC